MSEQIRTDLLILCLPISDRKAWPVSEQQSADLFSAAILL